MMVETFSGTSRGSLSYGVDNGDNEPRLEICTMEKVALDSVEKRAKKSKGV